MRGILLLLAGSVLGVLLTAQAPPQDEPDVEERLERVEQRLDALEQALAARAIRETAALDPEAARVRARLDRLENLVTRSYAAGPRSDRALESRVRALENAVSRLRR